MVVKTKMERRAYFIRFVGMLKSLKNKSPILLYILVCLLSFTPFLNELPRGVHAWGQADRFAIAKRYTQTGMDIRKISTYNMASDEGRTGAELPLVQYAAAALSQLNLEAYLPMLVRLINLLIFSIGLFMLLGQFQIKDQWLRLLTPSLLLSSPIIAFYAYNFLPDIAGLGFIFIMYSYLLRFMKDGKSKWIWWCLGLGLVGALIKLSVFIFLVANILYFAIQFIRKKTWLNLGLLTLGSAFASATVLLYIKYEMIAVNELYWSVVFRAHANPITSFSDLSDVAKGMFYWRTEYLSISLYILLFGAITGLVYSLKKRKMNWRWEGLTFHSLIVLGGLSIFVMKLGKQFIHHDYYFISTFIPLIFIGIIWFIATVLPKSKLNPGIIRFGFIGLALFAIGSTPMSYANRMKDQFKMRKHVIENNVGWLGKAAEGVEKASIRDNDFIFIMYHSSPNIPLVHFDRKGMCFNHEEIQRDTLFVEHWLRKLEPKFIIASRIWHRSLASDKAHLMPNLQIVYQNRDYVIWRRAENWSQFLSPTAKNN
jgi:hypothetical protein